MLKIYCNHLCISLSLSQDQQFFGLSQCEWSITHNRWSSVFTDTLSFTMAYWHLKKSTHIGIAV